MGTEEELYEQLYNSVVENDTIAIRKLLKKRINLKKHYGDEGNILNVVIDKGGPEQLKAVLEVGVSSMSDSKAHSYEMYNLINEPCNNQNQTPLMKSAHSGKVDCLKILLQHGANVNSCVKYFHMRAIDHALLQEHPSVPQIVLFLLRADSLFPMQEKGKVRLKELMNGDDEIKAFFNDRDSLHKKLKEMPFGKDLKNLIEKDNSSYYLNSDGQSALLTTAWNNKFDAWAYLKYKNARDTGEDEAMRIDMSLKSQRESFNRALAKYYFKVRGTQVMKMVAKSRILGDDESSGVTGDIIEGYYKHLNGTEMTSALLKIVHDEVDFEVIFDAHSSDVSRMIAIQGEKVRGLTEYNQNRVYVGTKLSEDYDKGKMLGTLAHELAHKAIAVVFKNHGKPYRKDDEEQKKKYMEVFSLLPDRVWFMDGVDSILRGVHTAIYPEEVLEQELIVRVPHMVAAYAENDKDDDGLAKLRNQFPELLNYYIDFVMPAFQKAISSSSTNNKMTVKDMSDFHKCLKASADEKISIASSVGDFREKVYRHNSLGVLKVSNMHLGLSHLKAQLVNEVTSEEVDVWHEPLFLSWQQFRYQWLNVMKALSNGAVSTLVISWSEEKPPEFCRKKRNCDRDCIFKKIVSDWVEEQRSIMNYDKISENIIIVLDTEVPSIKDIQPLDYHWSDLSENMKKIILCKEVLFQGEKKTVGDVIGAATTNCDVENFMSENLTPSEISYLIDEKHICIGEQPGWSSEEKMCKTLFHPKDYYIKRFFSHRKISKEALEKLLEKSESFVVRNANREELVHIGLKEALIRSWNPSDNDVKAQIYVIAHCQNRVNIEDTLCWCQNSYHPIHFLTLDSRDFVYDWSYGRVDNIMEYITADTNNYERGHYLNFIEWQETRNAESNNAKNKHLSEEQFIQHEITVKPEETHFKTVALKLKPTLIADNSGSGKSFVMNNIATALKKLFPDNWIVSTNLNFYASSHSQVWSDGLNNLDDYEKVIKFLFSMACTRQTASLDLTLFRTYAKRSGGIIVLFDGFDEICPKYKDEVIGFLKELSKTASIKFCVSTRLNERYDLQKALNCIAFRLVPFKIQNQTDFLNGYWNVSLKNYPNDKRLKKIQDIGDELTQFSKINPTVDIEEILIKLHGLAEAIKTGSKAKLTRHGINFSNFSEALIKNISRQNKDRERFTETPLHIFMVANVVFEENFAVAEKWNVSQLYEQFLYIKMKIFDKEKAMSSDSVAAGRSAEMAKKSAYKTLEKLSANIFLQPAPCFCNKEEIEDAVRVGLIKDVMGPDQFVHRSFAEYLFAKWSIRKAKKKKVTLFWLQKLFFDSTFSGVWWFLEHLLELKPEEKLHFKVSALSEEDLWRYINACLYVVVAVTFPSILQAFFNEFGVEVVRLLIKENNFPRESEYTEIGVNSYDWFIYPTQTIIKRASPGRGNFNVFQLIAYLRCFDGIEVFSTNNVGDMTKRLLQLVVENELTDDLNQNFKRCTWHFFLPEGFTSAFHRLGNYLSEIINFLAQHQETFRDTLKHVLTQNTEIWSILDANSYRAMDTLASDVLQQIEYSELILKNHSFVLSWSRILETDNIEEIEKIWNQVSKKMQYEERKSFLAGSHRYNQLHSALCNPSDIVWKYWWDLATSHVPTNECKKMIHSAVHPVFSNFTSDATHHCYQFLKKLRSDSYLDEKEFVNLIFHENDQMNERLAVYNHDLDLTARVFHLQHLVSIQVIPLTEYVCHEVAKYPCLWYITQSMVADMLSFDMEFNEQMMAMVNRYDEIVDSLSNSPLMNMQDKEQERVTKDHKLFISLFFSLLEMIGHHLNLEEFNSLTQLLVNPQLSSIMEFALVMPNILQLAQTLASPHLFGLFCAIVQKFVPGQQITALLYAVNGNGDTAFHIASRSHHALLNTLKTLAIDAMGERCLEELLQLKNTQGFSAEDLLRGADHSGGFSTSYDI
ncbi:uncharacterized protein LOC124164019 [Ischnura elegans]|uniref:uncharacterized protein LOC124164019 n=1 Tax=Ischnura elegans TaxID=197161 RepID=UPI001ED8BCCD|nr:uncharacterized protein LOC124164019 [Ischnura elegans]XP_046397126.1 uncharacterized protein LOC124164019 [Ischnura elegans]